MLLQEDLQWEKTLFALNLIDGLGKNGYKTFYVNWK